MSDICARCRDRHEMIRIVMVLSVAIFFAHSGHIDVVDDSVMVVDIARRCRFPQGLSIALARSFRAGRVVIVHLELCVHAVTRTAHFREILI